ncbi:MAG: hypothetical protein F9K32_09865 [Desulfobulbaceae bacterium]|nr:MAG: hypothetical protein F9K32_09865 [Desulfobulbaceae bacterium]
MDELKIKEIFSELQAKIKDLALTSRVRSQDKSKPEYYRNYEDGKADGLYEVLGEIESVLKGLDL